MAGELVTNAGDVSGGPLTWGFGGWHVPQSAGHDLGCQVRGACQMRAKHLHIESPAQVPLVVTLASP